jgi:hypothetical protein
LGFPHRDTLWPVKSPAVAWIWVSRKTRPEGCPVKVPYVGHSGA